MIQKKIAALFMAAVMILSLIPTNIAFAQASGGPKVRVIVKYRDNPNNKTKKNRKIKREIRSVDVSQNTQALMAELEAQADVEYVQIDYPMELYSLPSDPYLSLQWGLKNDGQEILGVEGVVGADINMEEVYDAATDLPEVVVGVLDTGVETRHSELLGRVVSPYNSIRKNTDVTPSDNSAHGTQIAGIIAAAHDGIGIAGAAPNAKIMPLKFMENGMGYTSDAINAIEYAKDKGVQIINCSWGSDVYNPILKDVMEINSDMLFICAAGNNGDTGYIYPAAFDLPNVISVAAVDNRDRLAESSNYGTYVHIAAPGVGIYTAYLSDRYDYAEGTSMAAAYVTAAAALYKGQYPDATPRQIAYAIKQGSRAPIIVTDETTEDDSPDTENPQPTTEEDSPVVENPPLDTEEESKDVEDSPSIVEEDPTGDENLLPAAENDTMELENSNLDTGGSILYATKLAFAAGNDEENSIPATAAGNNEENSAPVTANNDEENSTPATGDNEEENSAPVTDDSDAENSTPTTDGNNEENPTFEFSIPILDVTGMMAIQGIRELPVEEDDGLSGLDMEKLPPEVQALLKSDRLYTSLTQEEKDLLHEYLFVREDTMTECAEAGLNIGESITKAILMQRLNRHLPDIMLMIENHGGEKNAKDQSDLMSDYQYMYFDLNGDIRDTTASLLIKGYEAKQIGHAFVAAHALGADITSLIEVKESVGEAEEEKMDEKLEIDPIPPTENEDKTAIPEQAESKEAVMNTEPAEKEEEVANTEPAENEEKVANTEPAENEDVDTVTETAENEDERLTQLSEFYCINADALKKFIEKNDLSLKEAETKIERYESLSRMFFDHTNEALAATYNVQEGPRVLAPYNYKEGLNETISMNTGALILEDKIVSLKGRGGLDLNLTLKYNSMNGNTYDTYARSDYTFGTSQYILYRVRNNLLHDTAMGWSFNFSRIEMPQLWGKKYIHSADGMSYLMESKDDTNNKYVLRVNNDEHYLGKDIDVYDDPNSSSGANVRYYAKYIDGRKECFDSLGNLLSIQDRYSNKIEFRQVKSTFGILKAIEIIDTAGRKISIDQINSSDIVITLPDNSTVKYMLGGDNSLILRKTDQLGRITNYGYATFNDYFNYFDSSEPLLWTLYGKANGPQGIYKLENRQINTITYPTGAKSEYTYGKQKGKFGENGGYYYYYPITKRQDVVSGTAYNRKEYAYLYGNFACNNAYDVEMTDQKGIVTRYIFTAIHLLSGTSTKENNAEIARTSNSFNYTYIGAPFLASKTYYGQTTTERFTYETDGSLLTYWSPLAEGSASNTENRKDFTYDPAYKLPLTIKYKKDASTVAEQKNTLTADKKGVQSIEIRENGVLKSKKDFTYDIYGNVTQEKDYYANGQCYTTTFTYDAKGIYVTQKTTPLTTEKFEYDAMGQPTKYTDPKSDTILFQYDKLGRLTKKTNPDATYTQNTFIDAGNYVDIRNENGFTTRYQFTPLGDISAVTDVSTGNVLQRYEYDTLCRVVKEYDANGVPATYTYDTKDRVTNKTVNNSNTYVESYVYNDSALSQVKTILGDANAPDVKTAVYTDKFGRQTRDSFFLNGTEHSNSYSYDYLGNQISVLTAKDKKAGKAYSVLYGYDLGGNVTKTTNLDGSTYVSDYDWLGRKISAKDPKGNVFNYSYDALGRVTKETLPFDGASKSVKEYQYDLNGNVTRQTITNNKPGAAASVSQTAYTYNKRDWLTRADSYDNGAIAAYTTYEYDNVGNKTRMITANGTQTTEYKYDQFGRLLEMKDPLGLIETYAYDKNGNLLTKKDRKKQVIENEYDTMNRLKKTKATGADGVTAPQFSEYTYTKTGAKRTEKNENLTVTYTYDSLGLPITAEESNGMVKSYTYDLAGNRTGFTLKKNGAVTTNQAYDYDVMNRLEKVYKSGSAVAAYGYDLNGNRVSLTYGNGVTTTYAYNNANLVTGLENKRGSTRLSSYAYVYYLDGNQASKTDHTGRTTTYAYDGLGRLTYEAETAPTGNLTKTYAYDTAGNRKTLTVTGREAYTTSYGYDLDNRLLTEEKKLADAVETRTYGYDLNGNQISMISSAVRVPSGNNAGLGVFLAGKPAGGGASPAAYELNAYDPFNRLTQTLNEKGTAQFAYKPDGLRLSKTIDGVKTTHVWDGMNIVMDLDANNNVKDQYTFGIGLIANNSGYYLYNAHGDVVQLANSAGAVTRNYHYDAFGVEENMDAADANPFRYCGEYFDKEIGTTYGQGIICRQQAASSQKTPLEMA